MRPPRRRALEPAFAPRRTGTSAVAARPLARGGPQSPAGDGAGRNERAKVECPFCGYKCFPQWLNDEAHCLKCDKVIKTQLSIPAARHRGAGARHRGPSRRQPGEASTYKVSPGSAMESISGDCQASPDGSHHWKFGKCAYCQKGEGKFEKPGAMANPGAKVGGCSAGGKCIYKFSKCTKCGKREY
ncbi:unnamed protein product [Prorocentrum cordatum]|uniref:Uncharacterized protein n=1 Tax=Prorocentrum cordatum TaxID=2364126 RepID=A0ABN9VPI0_9DINO|nr:unnamed protein product [Polarella glacialis]